MRENRPSGLMRGGARWSLASCLFNPSAPPTLLRPLQRANDKPSSNPKPRSTLKRHECRAPRRHAAFTPLHCPPTQHVRYIERLPNFSHRSGINAAHLRTRRPCLPQSGVASDLPPHSKIVPSWMPQRRTSVEFSKPSVVELLAPRGVSAAFSGATLGGESCVMGRSGRLRRAGELLAARPTLPGARCARCKGPHHSSFFIQILVDVQSDVMHDCAHGCLVSIYRVQ